MAEQKATKMNGVSASAPPPYTSRIIKAGALLDDTKTLLSHWDTTAPVPENLDRIRRENVFGKASRSRVEDILAVFRQRYLTEAEVTKSLVVLVKNRLPAASLDRVLYFHAATADRLLHDTVTDATSRPTNGNCGGRSSGSAPAWRAPARKSTTSPCRSFCGEPLTKRKAWRPW